MIQRYASDAIGKEQLVITRVQLELKRVPIVGIVVKIVPIPHVTYRDAPLVPRPIVDFDPQSIGVDVG